MVAAQLTSSRRALNHSQTPMTDAAAAAPTLNAHSAINTKRAHNEPLALTALAGQTMRADGTASAAAVGSALLSSDRTHAPAVSPHTPSAATPRRFATPPVHSPNMTATTRLRMGGSPHSQRSPAAAGLSVQAAFLQAMPDDSRNTPYPTAEIIQRTQQADNFRSAQQQQQTGSTRLPPAAIVTTTRRSDSPDRSPTMDDLVSSELRPAPTTILESPQQKRHQLGQQQDSMPMSDTISASPERMLVESAIAPSTREQSSASESSSGRSLLSPGSTNSSASPVLPPSQGFSFRSQHGGSAASDDADEQPADEQTQDDDAAEQDQSDQTLQAPPQSQTNLITPPHILLQQQQQPASSSSSAAPVDVHMLRASSVGAEVAPSLGVVDLAHRIAPVQPPLPTWCGLPQPTQTSTKRLKTTPLSSPSSSRAPRLSQAIENAAAAASAASSNDAATASMFHFDTSPLTTNGLFGQHLAAASSSAATALPAAAAPSSPRSSPPPLHSNSSSSHTSPPSAAAPASSMPNYLWQLVCNSSDSGSPPESIQLWTRPCWLIGRHTSCDLVLDHISISRLHARLLVHCITGQLYLQDLNSTHGTFVNGQRILGMHKSAVGGSFQLLDPHRSNGAISSFALSATPSPSAAGAFPLAKGSQIVFGASQKTYTLLQHDEVPAGSELHALPPRAPLSSMAHVLLAPPPPLRKTLSDGSIPPSPVLTHILSPSSSAVSGGVGVLPSCTLDGGMLALGAPLKLLQTSTSLSNLADLQRRQANVHRKRKVVSFTADTKTRDGSVRTRAAADTTAVSDSACSTPRADNDDDSAAESKMQTGEDEADEEDDEDAKPKRQGMTAEEICLQRKMAASAAAVAVPILKLPSFPFAPRAFSAPTAGKVAARQQLAHVLATPSTPSLGDRPAGLESGAASVGAPSSSRPVAVFPLMANSSSCSTSAAPSLSSPFSTSAVGASFSSGYSSPAAAAFSSASSVMRQPSVSSLNMAGGSGDAASASASSAAAAASVVFRPSLKHARDTSANDDAALREQADEDEEEKVDAHAILSPEQRQTNETYERLLPQPINSPASAASFTSLSLMSHAASSSSFPAHASKSVPVVHGSSPFASNGLLLSPHHAISAAVHTAQLGLSPHAGSPPPMQFAVAAAQAAALGDSDMIA